MRLYSKRTTMPPVASNHHHQTPSKNHTTHYTARAWCAIISFKSVHQFPTASHLASPLAHQTSPLRPPTPPTYGKNIPAPPRTSASLQFATKQRRAARLGLSLDHVMRGRATDVNSTNRILLGMYRVSTRDRYNPCPVARTRQDRGGEERSWEG